MSQALDPFDPKPKRRINRRPEQDLQKQVAKYLDLVLPDGCMWWHTPNGGKRNQREAEQFKAMGTKAGIPDIFILHRGKLYAIELKAGNNSLSEPQKRMRGKLLAAGLAGYCECNSLDTVRSALTVFEIPTRDASSSR